MPQEWPDIPYDRLSNGDDLSIELPLSPLMEDSPSRHGLSPRHGRGMGERMALSPIAEIDVANLSSMFEADSEKDDDSPIMAYNPADGPPTLHYPIESKKMSIFTTWTIIILMNTIAPVTIFYVLRHATDSSTDLILNLVQIPMTPTLFQFPWRLWQLKRRKGERSPRHRSALTWDFFQWQFLFGALLTTGVCVVAGVIESYKLFALAPPILFSEVCLQLIVFDIMAALKLRQPCRISSVPKGSPFRPGVYYIIEDLTAVDGAGGTDYRDRLTARWEASPPFQRLVRDIGRITGFSGMLMVGIELTLILLTPAEVFFGASWIILWAWAGLSAYGCVSYTKTCLQVEKEWWKEDMPGGTV